MRRSFCRIASCCYAQRVLKPHLHTASGRLLCNIRRSVHPTHYAYTQGRCDPSTYASATATGPSDLQPTGSQCVLTLASSFVSTPPSNRLLQPNILLRDLHFRAAQRSGASANDSSPVLGFELASALTNVWLNGVTVEGSAAGDGLRVSGGRAFAGGAHLAPHLSVWRHYCATHAVRTHERLRLHMYVHPVFTTLHTAPTTERVIQVGTDCTFTRLARGVSAIDATVTLSKCVLLRNRIGVVANASAVLSRSSNWRGNIQLDVVLSDAARLYTNDQGLSTNLLPTSRSAVLSLRSAAPAAFLAPNDTGYAAVLAVRVFN